MTFSTRRFSLVMLSLSMVALAGGCGVGATDVPQTTTVTLPDGTQVQATLGSGVVTLADSRWQVFQAFPGGQGSQMLTLVFGSEGELVSFEDSTLAAALFGTTLIFDGQRHDTVQSGVQYAAGTFGAETSDSTGFTFVGELSGFFAGIQAATASASAAGTFDPEDPDVITGTFTFKSEVTLLDIPEANVDDTFDFIARRVVN